MIYGHREKGGVITVSFLQRDVTVYRGPLFLSMDTLLVTEISYHFRYFKTEKDSRGVSKVFPRKRFTLQDPITPPWSVRLIRLNLNLP